jgi:hypothetical protein
LDRRILQKRMKQKTGMEPQPIIELLKAAIPDLIAVYGFDLELKGEAGLKAM